MILESILIVTLALILDFVFGDPKNKFHPTAWIGTFIAKLVPLAKNPSTYLEKLGGIAIVVTITGMVATFFVLLDIGISNVGFDIVAFVLSIAVGGILLKTTIAIRGMEKHAMSVMEAISRDDLDAARTNLSKIVKRNTKDLDKNHILSGTMESISENTVDGITGPMFYFAFFGLPGAFVYRTINTVDSMIGYKTSLFRNIGWFGANCDKVLNYLPARITGFVMILSAMILGKNWKSSFQIMKQDGAKTESPNAGYPMAALAGALGTRFEKIDHYTVGQGNFEFTKTHLKSAIALMKVTTILFCGVFTIPVIVVLAYFGWWIHA